MKDLHQRFPPSLTLLKGLCEFPVNPLALSTQVNALSLEIGSMDWGEGVGFLEGRKGRLEGAG
jgi:hypothetical protein